MADRKHLQRRGTVWHYRRRVPEELVKAYGKPYVHQSLHTGSIKEAQKLRNCLDVQFDAEFAQTSAPQPDQTTVKAATLVLNKKTTGGALGRSQIASRVADYVEAKIGGFARSNEVDPIESEAIKNDLEQERQDMMKALSQPGNFHRDEWVSRTFEHLFPNPAFSDVTHDQVAEIVRRGLIEVVKGELAVLADEYDRPVSDPLFKALPSQRTTFGEVARDFQEREAKNARINNYREQWVERVAAGVSFLIECVGDETPVVDVDFKVCERVQTIIATIPRNRARLYPGLAIDDAVKNARENGAATLASDSQGRYLDFFRSIMELAQDRRIVAHNPARNLRPLRRDKVADKDKRKPLSVQQIADFFGSAFYGQWKRGEACTYTKKDRDWRFWLPLIMTFAGMRPSEICQMVASDIRQSKAGTWYADVVASDEDDAGPTKKLKTEQSRRKYPLHPSLIEAGFLDFVAERREDGADARLFSSLKPGQKGYLSDYPSKRFRNQYLPDAIHLEPRQTFYSFRHSFRDALRRIDAPSDVVAALGGWSEGSKVSDGYGDAGDPDYLVTYVRKITYPGLVLDFAYTPPPAGSKI
ncbi:site-specific integrase [Mesorhizobium sp.]|uniref:site-specific integrase n=1 Tax=Mesorhizobium sp. TaxID=1871066 RepID=UPI0025BAF823|nr:site-specific integrase [Mesorhizobium sp.]